MLFRAQYQLIKASGTENHHLTWGGGGGGKEVSRSGSESPFRLFGCAFDGSLGLGWPFEIMQVHETRMNVCLFIVFVHGCNRVLCPTHFRYDMDFTDIHFFRFVMRFFSSSSSNGGVQ